MSDTEEQSTEEKIFFIDRAKQGRAACKKCKGKCSVGELRIAKVVPSPFGSGKMKNWFHLDCIFEQFLKQRVNTKRIESCDDLDGWDNLNDEDKENLIKKIEDSEKTVIDKYGLKKEISVSKKIKTPVKPTSVALTKLDSVSKDDTNKGSLHKDCFFREFRRLVADISNVDSYTEKTTLVSIMFSKGSDGKGFKGDIIQWCRLLLPGVIKRIYNIQSKQLLKLFSKIFCTNQTKMLEHLNQGDIGETIQHFYEESNVVKPAKKSMLTMQEVDNFLENLSQLTKEDEQINHFKDFVAKCTSNDLKMVIRLIKHDLRMNAGAKHVLQGIHPDAYAVYQASRDLNTVINRCLNKNGKTNEESRVKASISVMTPIQPMLAEACKSVQQAMKKCPNGMYAEIKYDGERVQLHKCGNEFKFYSRSLKPVLPHKISHFKEYIPKAFPHANDLILDSEILMIDTNTGKPLPFGTLGVHKKSEFKDANVCLFIFDCMYYNGESLIQKPIERRKKILKDNMTEISNRILFSELKIITEPKELSSMIAQVLEMGLEGLVLKDLKSVYEPGKRHWLKVKKDYLHDGAMADTADLIVLGAWYGTGRKAGLMSVFLMGCYNEKSDKYCTVTKVHTGHDDKTLEQLQTKLQMIKINSDPTKVPSWLVCTNTMIPDFVAKDPKQQPVWEITGAEFTQHDVHTADGISIRFPRVTKIRDDKNWKTATTLMELQNLYQKSKEGANIQLMMELDDENNIIQDESTPENLKKRKRSQPKIKNLTPPKYLKFDGVEKIKQPLPDTFKNVKLLIQNEEQGFNKLKRHFIAYGGTLLKSEQWKEATHVLHLQDTVDKQTLLCPKSARHITLDWIVNSICEGNLQNVAPYTVKLQPLQV